MVLNDYMPEIEIDPETYTVTADGEVLTCEPAESLPWHSDIFVLDDASYYKRHRAHNGREHVAIAVVGIIRATGRGSAADSGFGFDFDLTEALSHGDCIYETDTKSYLIEQSPRLLSVRLKKREKRRGSVG